MPISILMPALSPTMKEGNLVKWHKKKGDTVEAGDMLADIETDKATMEVEAVDEGTVGALLLEEGAQNVAVNTPIAVLLEDGEDESALAPFLETIGSTATPAAGNTQAPAKETDAQPQASTPQTDDVPAAANTSAPSKASPLARKLAESHNLALETIKGSGPYGRVVKRDIEAALQQGTPQTTSQAASQTTAASAPAMAPPRVQGTAEENFSGYEPPFQLEPITGMRQVIGDRLCLSKTTQPHFYLSLDVSMDAVLRLRQTILKKMDVKLSINDFVLKATAQALKEIPSCNSAWSSKGIRLYETVDLAVAVSLDKGLITPVIRSAETKNIRTLSKEMKTLAKDAREGGLKPDAFQGGTFTVSSLGMFGINVFSAIINPPQSGILAVGAMRKVPAFDANNAVVAQQQATLTLSVDHRLVDGVQAALFLNKIKDFIEDPSMMVV
ncbi:MAG: pyruvate dehydrogenase complex dihydrolipoamide acetyltransferase [Holosporaceae bacterium]